ncbi:MAG: phospholipid carrier-dependent glycosyltransferase [Acidobacteria bacterium]|nr:phospholipid carrier-dependent glycosyltransferase [Acidobacteriota bacterium]
MSKANSNSKGGNAVIVAIWAAVLLVVFVSFRSTDLLSLPRLLGNLGGGALFGAGLIDSLVGAIAASCILAAWFGLGSVVSLFLTIERREADSHVLELARTVAIGSVLWSIIWFFLGISGGFAAWTAISATVVGIICCVPGIKRLRAARGESRIPEAVAGVDRIVAGIIAFALLLTFVAALAPPTAKDTLLYHFALPKAFIAQHSNAFVEGNIASYLALGGEMHFVWAMLLGGLYSVRAGEAAAGTVAFLYLPLLLAVVFGWARELGVSRRWSLVAVLLVAAIPTVFHSASSGYTDVALALYATLAAYSLLRWFDGYCAKYLVYLAIFLGGALAIKLTTLFFIAGLLLIVLLRVRNETSAGKLAGTAILAFVFAGVLASPWYLRTWTATGSPLFPFYLSVWKGAAPGWDVERSNLFQAMNAQYGGVDLAPGNYLLAPLRLSLAAQPEDANLYDGVLGAAFLLGIPLLWFGIRRKADPAITTLAAIAGIYFLFWLFSSEQIRYLLPIVPLLAIAIAASGNRSEETGTQRAWYYALAFASFLGVATSFAWFSMRSPLRVVLGGETRDAYLAKQLDYYGYYAWLNAETRPDAKVWLINMRRDTYDLDRAATSDYLFEDWTLRQLVWQSKDINELRAAARKVGANYILARHDFLFDYDRSTLVDDKRPRPENAGKLQLAKELLLDPERTVKKDDKFSLMALD